MNQTQREALRLKGYIVGAQIGKGTFGTVFQCTDMRTHVTYAVKVMDLRALRMRAEFSENRLKREVQVMTKLNHPFIVGLKESIMTSDTVFLVMELVIGIDLFDTIVAKGGFDELGAQFIFCQLCLALDYIHDQGVIHRDVKPENILLRGPSSSLPTEMAGTVPSKTWIKLVDFGLSKIQESEGEMNSFVGTPRYIAPEVITVGEEEKRRRANNGSSSSTSQTARSTYGTPADCYSAGICLFVMLCNCFPKFHEGIVILDTNNGRGQRLTLEARDLILGLTEPDPSRRFTMKQALMHPWLTPAKEWVERLLRNSSATSIVSIARSPSITSVPSNGPSSSATTSASATTRPLKRTFVAANQSPASSFMSFPSTVPSTAFPAFSTDIQQRNQALSTEFVTPSASPIVSGQALVAEIERELRMASLASNQICSMAEVRGVVRAMSNMLVQSERVVIKCAQTGMNVIDQIPDLRAIVSSGQGGLSYGLPFVKSMLEMVKQWLDGLKREANDTLGINHTVLVQFGSLVQQLSLSPDVVAESIASMSMDASSPVTSPTLKCLKHFEQIESLLRVHESFWGKMDAAMNVLQQRSLIMENMAQMVASAPQFEERFYQKLEEYFTLWHSATLLCQQYQASTTTVTGQNPLTGASPMPLGAAQQPASLMNGWMPPPIQSIPPQNSTVVVMNETSPSPNSSLESYEGDI